MSRRNGPIPIHDESELTWDAPLPGETAISFSQFCIFRDMGPYRTLRRVAEQVGRSPKSVRALSATNHWVKRALLYDAHLDAIKREANEKAILEMNARQAEIGRLMQEQGLAALKARKPESLEPAEAARYIESGAKIERLARGEVDSRTGQDIKIKGPSWDDVRRALLSGKTTKERQLDESVGDPWEGWKLPDIPIKYERKDVTLPDEEADITDTTTTADFDDTPSTVGFDDTTSTAQEPDEAGDSAVFAATLSGGGDDAHVP